VSRIAGLDGATWPDPEDVVLLRFLLHSDPEQAIAAWRAWRPGWDPDAPTSEQYRLYPLMAERVAALIPGEPKLGMLQGVRLQSAVQTLLILDQLEDVLATLDGIGIDGVVLKGAALALSVYDHLAQRPFHDLDVFVDPRRHAEAISALRGQGWILRRGDFTGNQAVMLDRAGVSLDLHRKHSRELVVTGSPFSAWDNIETVTARRPLRSGRTIRILAPADALLHTIVHGTQYQGSVPLRWVVDAHRLVVSGDLDWERVTRLAELFQVGAVVHDSLVFLRDTTGTSLPDDVLLRLSALRVPRLSRRRMAAFRDSPNTNGRLGGLPLLVRQELQYTLDQPWFTVLTAAPGYFRAVWELERKRQLPGELARRIRRRRGNRRRSGTTTAS
jgi:hypothetical protein